MEISVPGLGQVVVDIVYGGAFYAFVTAADVGVEFGKTRDSTMKSIATDIKGKTLF